MLEVFAVRQHACMNTLAPLINSIVYDAVVDVTPHLLQTLFQFISSSVLCTRDWYTRCWTTLQIL